VIQVPLWTPDEPFDYVSYGGEQYYKTIGKKEWTQDAVIAKYFVPIFKDLLQFIYADQGDIKDLDELFQKMMAYFNDYDFKETMRSAAVWDTYKRVIESVVVADRNPLCHLTRSYHRNALDLSIFDSVSDCRGA
jgi:hypothetical protein